MNQKDSRNERFIIDSFGWIEYFSDGKLAGKYAKYIEKSEPGKCLTPSIIIYEVYKKLKSLYSEEEAITAIAHIENCSTIVDIDMKVALKGADSGLEKKLSMADTIIWGIADMFNAKIITSDNHFRDKENVIFIE